MKMETVCVMVLLSLLLAGCFGTPKRDMDYAPIPPSMPSPTPVGNGSIYQEGYANVWFENIRARRVGDMLTIRLVERTNASKSAGTSVSKDNTTSVLKPSVLGLNTGIDLSAEMESAHAFDGSGDSSQSNQLTGDITVSVVDVLPNGYLLVRGEKRIGINQGNEYIKLSGLVRPVDIDANNTVLSTRVADPTIIYSGDGAVADSNAMGWLARFFIGQLWPF